MLEELIKVFKQNDKDLVSARELYKVLDIKKRFSSWIAQYIDSNNDYGFEKDIDFCYVLSSTHQNQYGGTKDLDDYALTTDMAKEIGMMTRTAIGRQVRKYFIERDKKLTAIENEVRKQINNGAIHGAYGKEFKKYPHAYVDELMYKNSILGGKEAYQLANIIYECGIEEGKK